MPRSGVYLRRYVSRSCDLQKGNVHHFCAICISYTTCIFTYDSPRDTNHLHADHELINCIEICNTRSSLTPVRTTWKPLLCLSRSESGLQGSSQALPCLRMPNRLETAVWGARCFLTHVSEFLACSAYCTFCVMSGCSLLGPAVIRLYPWPGTAVLSRVCDSGFG
jgi:hypothetical protein